MSRVLVTGGAGYIGCHAAVELIEAGHEVVIVDDLSNSFREAVARLEKIVDRSVSFHEGDYADPAVLDRVLPEVDAVMHFGGFKAVGESVEIPLEYYRNNVAGTIALLQAMERHDVKRMVFSSSCTVYGQPESIPVDESAPRSAASPYGNTKLIIEDMLRDAAAADPGWRVMLLRYFNPVGAHPSGRIGEDPRGIPNNLMPFVMQVAAGKLEELRVFGDDYPTRDGTCIRDYIHVVDLARGHLAALDALGRLGGCRAYNLGTGTGTTVLEVVAAVEEVLGATDSSSDRRAAGG